MLYHFSSKPAMQIRQLEALQAMAKTANSKVVFVPMSLIGDGGGNGGGGGGGGGMFAGEASTSVVPAVINSMSEV
jgi:hypothetical protein